MNMINLKTLRLGLAAAASCLVLGALGWSYGDIPAAFGGGGGTSGDTVGSLPMMAAPGSGDVGVLETSPVDAGPAVPSFALMGEEQDILDMIIDAYPTGPGGGFERIPIGATRARYVFSGRLTVLIDRAKFASGSVRAEILTGASFNGGLASIAVGGTVRAQQILLQGVKDMRLKSLDAAGVLAEGLTWHGVSLDDQHRIVAVKALNNVLRVDQRD